MVRCLIYANGIATGVDGNENKGYYCNKFETKTFTVVELINENLLL